MKQVSNLILLVLIVLNIYSCNKKNELPAYATLPAMALRDPIQIPTSRPSFSAVVEDQKHSVKPIFEYRICGMVVSCGFSKHQADYRKDKLNIMDVGILWGSNLDPAIYRHIKFHTDGVWLKAKTKDKAVWEKLDQAQLSNNHLLSTNPVLTKQAKALKRGDVISIQGCLANYSGRRSSIVRSDTGASACEIIWVDKIEVLRDGTRPWHLLHKSTLYGFALWLIIRFALFIRPAKSAPRQWIRPSST
ncbi:MAG: hypothetical protein KJN67_04955 [Pontiella sp.]|nr:hypothetical protein [Pontiella sp.]